MQLTALLLFLAGLGLALPLSEPDSLPPADPHIICAWRHPSATDVRSPCPGLNILANHNLINPTGRNITLADIGTAIHTAYNFEAAFLLAGIANHTGPVIDLNFLNKHNLLEHDGSLTRADFEVNNGDNFSFRPELFNEWAEHVHQCSKRKPDFPRPGPKVVDVEGAARARWGRIQTAKATNPKFEMRDDLKYFSYLESAILMVVLGGVEEDGKLKGQFPFEWARAFFGKLLL